MNRLSKLTIALCASTLSACAMNDDYQYNASYYYRPYTLDQTQYYPSMYSNNMDVNYNIPPDGGNPVQVPDSYLAGVSHTPQRAKDSDRNWVSSQNPQKYTIEVADDQKPAAVAGKLYKLPKNDRAAEVQYQRDGKSYYKGLYGSYSSQQEAQKALDALPPEVKQNAGVKDWGSVQNHVNN